MQRYFVSEINDNKFKLSIEDSHHIETVMRMNLGDLIEVIFNNQLYIAKIIKFNPVIVEIIEKNNTNNELENKVIICQSLVKETKMDLILQKCTELGMYSFIPLSVKNSIIKGSNKDFEKKVIRWQKIVEGASRQSKRNIIPKVNKVIDINELLKLDFDLKILCTVNEVSRSLKYVLQNHKNCDTMIIVIGPEGGFTKEEEQLLIDNGYISTSLGNLVLRTETAGICVLSMINYEYER